MNDWTVSGGKIKPVPWNFATREKAEKEVAKNIRADDPYTLTVVEVDALTEILGPMPPITELHIRRTLEVALNAEFDQKWQEYTKRRT